MDNLQKIFLADQISNCIPGWSTLTNGFQLLYKLAHKVDAAANPVAPGWKTDVKIHILNKKGLQNLSSYIGLIPVLGNLAHLIGLAVICAKFGIGLVEISELLPLPLKVGIDENNKKLVRLCLANGYLTRDPQKVEKLKRAARDSNYEIFEQIFNSCEWSAEEVIDAIGMSDYYPQRAEKASCILRYWKSKNLGANFVWDNCSKTRAIEAYGRFANNGTALLAQEILGILPICTLKEWAPFFTSEAGSFWLLKNKESVMAKCCVPAPATLVEEVFVYSKQLRDSGVNSAQYLKAQVEILGFFVDKVAVKSDHIHAISLTSLILNCTEFFNLFLGVYENEINDKMKKEMLIAINPSNKQDRVLNKAYFSQLLMRWKDAFSKDEMIAFLQQVNIDVIQPNQILVDMMRKYPEARFASETSKNPKVPAPI